MNNAITEINTLEGTNSRIMNAINLALVNAKKIEIIPCIFSDHNAVRLDVNYRRKTINNPNIWRLNNTMLNNQQITKEIRTTSETTETTLNTSTFEPQESQKKKTKRMGMRKYFRQ